MFSIDENGRSATSFGARHSALTGLSFFFKNAPGDSRFCF
jgi:hypothetical protein